jgi:hypothetical protein
MFPVDAPDGALLLFLELIVSNYIYLNCGFPQKKFVLREF